MKYIAFLNENKRVMKISDTPFKHLSVLMTQCEVDYIPEKYDYLIAEFNGNKYSVVAKFNEYTPKQIEKQRQKKYENLVKHYIRQKYSQDQVEAIVNNYLSKMENETYKNEFLVLQEYRIQCKAKAHKEVYGY